MSSCRPGRRPVPRPQLRGLSCFGYRDAARRPAPARRRPAGGSPPCVATRGTRRTPPWLRSPWSRSAPRQAIVLSPSIPPCSARPPSICRSPPPTSWPPSPSAPTRNPAAAAARHRRSTRYHPAAEADMRLLDVAHALKRRRLDEDRDAASAGTFTIGDVLCRGRRRCEPCAHLERLSGPGHLRPLIHRGGLRADILTDGTIPTGAAIRPGPQEP